VFFFCVDDLYGVGYFGYVVDIVEGVFELVFFVV